MHDTVEEELARAQNNVLTRLFDFSAEKWVAFVDFTQAVQHFRQLGRIHRLHRYLDHRRGVETQRTEDLRLLKLQNLKSINNQ